MSKAKDAASAPPAEIIPPSKTKAALAKMGLASTEERDPELEGLMSEIESDLRDEELRKIWQAYGKLIIAACVAVVLGVIGVQMWRKHTEDQRLELARLYTQAAAASNGGRNEEALTILGDIAKHGGEGYGAVAELQRAALLLQKNDVDGAVVAYKTLAADSKADQNLRDLATLLQVLHSLDREKPQTLEETLAPLLNPGNPFSPSALELSALLAAKEGDTARAAKLAEQIVAEPTAPQSLRARAQDLVAYYKAQSPAAPAPTAAKPEAAQPEPAKPEATKPQANKP